VANYNIGALALGHRDYKLAAKAYEVVAKAWPNRYDVHASLGYALQGLQQFDRAADELVLAQKIKLENAVVKVDPSEEEQLALQTVIVLQSAGKNEQALSKAEEYLRAKGMTCTSEDLQGFCGRYNGIKINIQMEKEAAAQPAEEKKEAIDAEKSNIFTDQPVEGGEGEGAPPAEGAPADGGGGETPGAGTAPQ
jgi:hypothetical protein